ncbi:papilin-like [Saccostrea echinata]|uniref:papilin-like n=1 Tax=Saccostrea echinata TaxID=191078 RepID=UPI002A7FDF0D|nr:papilin-like [Saccostrea echinata]
MHKLSTANIEGTGTSGAFNENGSKKINQGMTMSASNRIPGSPGRDPPETLPPPPRVMLRPRVPFTCTLFVDSGYFCPFGSLPSTQYYYDPFTQRCQSFYYRGCGGTPNRFSSRTECLRSCGCFSDIDFGNICPISPFEPPVYRYTIRYAFDQFSGTCQPFRFSSCNGRSNGGNNNFRSQLDCQTTCGPNFNSDLGPFPINRAPIGASNGGVAVMPNRDMSPIPSNNAQQASNAASVNTIPSESPFESQINFGSSSIMAEKGSSNGNMGISASEFNFGSSSLSAGNMPFTERNSMMPSFTNSGNVGIPSSMFISQPGSSSFSGNSAFNGGLGIPSPINMIYSVLGTRGPATFQSGNGLLNGMTTGSKNNAY